MLAVTCQVNDPVGGGDLSSGEVEGGGICEGSEMVLAICGEPMLSHGPEGFSAHWIETGVAVRFASVAAHMMNRASGWALSFLGRNRFAAGRVISSLTRICGASPGFGIGLLMPAPLLATR